MGDIYSSPVGSCRRFTPDEGENQMRNTTFAAFKYAMSPATTTVLHELAAHVRLAPGRSTSPSIKEQFCGTWKLVSWKIEQPSGEVIDSPLGPDPVGWDHVPPRRLHERCNHASGSPDLFL